jgi:uncharacterized protein YciI
MFIVKLTYLKPIDEVETFLADHVEFLEKYYALKKFIVSGRQNPRVGGIIVMRCESSEEVEQIISEDPFKKETIVDYEVIEFVPTKYDPEFKRFIKG